MLTVSVFVNPFFFLIQVIIFLFLSSIQHLAFVFYWVFFDKILKLKFNSNCTQEANNVIFAAILPLNFPVSFPNRDNFSIFSYICYSPSPSSLLIHILTVTFFCTAMGKICFTLFLLLVIYFHPNLLVLLEISLDSRIN